jgi:hypothetical protein
MRRYEHDKPDRLRPGFDCTTCVTYLPQMNAPVLRCRWRGDPVTDPTSFGGWLLRCDPTTWDLAQFLDDGETRLESWSVTHRAHLISPGDPAVFWVSKTGARKAKLTPGIWGTGTIASEVYKNQAGDYWLDEDKARRTHWYVDVTGSLFVTPVSQATVEATAALADMEALRAPRVGNPVWLTVDEFAAIKALCASAARR